MGPRYRVGLPVVAGIALALAIVPLAAERQSNAPYLSVKALLEKASQYVSGYQREFAFLVADEHVEQRTNQPAPGEASSRTTRGELFLTYLGAERRWISVRDVAEVDGRPVSDREDLAALLRRSSIAAVAPRIITHNARYNLGNVVRNFNEPTIALLVLAAPRVTQFRFSMGPIDRHGPGLTLVTLTFREFEEPTLIRSTTGAAAFATGEVTIEAETGRVRRTQLVVKDGSTVAELTTTFEANEAVGLWVPAWFDERYTARRDNRDELITSKAHYTNYRRFEAEGRLR